MDDFLSYNRWNSLDTLSGEVSSASYHMQTRSDLSEPNRVLASISVPATGGVGASEQTSQHLIVVIEDESIVLMGYRMLFESWGYRVVACTSLDEALQELSMISAVPNLIVSDYRLRKGETGVGAIQSIRTHYQNAIPAILITGDTAVDRLREAAGSGIPILHKPVNGLALQKMLAETVAAGV